MISYANFWDTLKASDETTYTLIKKHHIPSATINRLRKDHPLSTTTIDTLCRIFDCRVEDIMRYIPRDGAPAPTEEDPPVRRGRKKGQ